MRRVRLLLLRSCPTRPAACHVAPCVSCSRSSSATSRSPRLARWYAMLQPTTPPPMMTMRLFAGTAMGDRFLVSAQI